MGCRSFCTTSSRAARRRISPSRTKCWSAAMDKRPALGKGLSALIPDFPDPPRPSTIDVDIDRLTPNKFQPRARADDARLDDLAQSIKANGIIQPIRRRPYGDRL